MKTKPAIKLKSLELKICMSPSAHYVTQQSLFDIQIKGTLTNAAIRKYALQGRYTTEQQRLAERSKRIAAHNKRNTEAQLNALLQKLLQ